MIINTSNWMKRIAVIAGSALMGLTLTMSASAANPEQVPVEVEWVAPVAIAEDNPLQFGMLDIATAAGQTVTINTDDSYSELTANTVVGGTQAAAEITITVPDGTGISILVDNVAAATFYTLGTWMCSYAGAVAVACDSAYPIVSSGSSSSGDTVEIGATLTTVGGASVSVDDTTFDVTVIYQ
jgi:hypothetical protein